MTRVSCPRQQQQVGNPGSTAAAYMLEVVFRLLEVFEEVNDNILCKEPVL